MTQVHQGASDGLQHSLGVVLPQCLSGFEALHYIETYIAVSGTHRTRISSAPHPPMFCACLEAVLDRGQNLQRSISSRTLEENDPTCGTMNAGVLWEKGSGHSMLQAYGRSLTEELQEK